ncbi:MAG: BrnT family toxin [Reyranellaceae bacterium]
MPSLRFTWDLAKARSNLVKHGVAFETAATIFDGRTVELPDDRFNYGEEHWVAIGLANDRELTVVYTVTDDDRFRLISARGATTKERRLYWKSVGR